MTTQKPRIEATQESQERLEVMELDRTTREEKMTRETAFLPGATEVAYEERAFRQRHPATVDEVRAAVDALRGERRGLPPVPALPPLPEPPAPVAPPIPEHLRRALAPVVEGELVAVEEVYASEAGEVVDAFYLSGGERRSRQFLLKEGVAVPVEGVGDRIDALPPPAPPAPAEAPPAPEPEKKGRFSIPKLPKRKAKDATPPAEPPADDEKKRRFRLPGRK